MYVHVYMKPIEEKEQRENGGGPRRKDTDKMLLK